MLVQTCLSVWKVGQSRFNHCGDSVKLLRAFLSVWKDRHNHFTQSGGAILLVQACLRVGKGHLKHCGGPVKLVQAFVFGTSVKAISSTVEVLYSSFKLVYASVGSNKAI